MQIQVDEIRIRKRIRKDPGDLRPLMESMRKHGILNPIVITTQNVLVAGYRRLEAAKRLGWQSVPVQVIDANDALTLLEIEIEENAARKDFSSDEMADAFTRMDKLKNPGVIRRLWYWFGKIFRRILSIFRR